MKIDLKTLKISIEKDAAIRRVQRLQPVGGTSDKVFPPTYPGNFRNDPTRHVFETRRINGNNVKCVLLDSVQSQANRLEEALLNTIRKREVSMPYIIVDFKGQISETHDLSDLGEITSLDAPHRVFDAIIRDSQLGDKKFTETDHYKKLQLAKPTNATSVFKLSPNSLLFGAWNSTGEGGGLGAKFTRCIVSEIVGIEAGEGQNGAIRIDPLGVSKDVKVVGGVLDWKLAGTSGAKSVKPSEINHSNIISNLVPRGVTIDYALHTTVLSLAGLRRLKFPETNDETAGRTVLASLALVAMTEQDSIGYALRSRCDLVCDGKAPFEIVHQDGSTEEIEINADDAVKVFKESVSAAKNAGFPWDEEPIRLKPQERLVELVARSRAKALAGEAENDNK